MLPKSMSLKFLVKPIKLKLDKKKQNKIKAEKIRPNCIDKSINVL